MSRNPRQSRSQLVCILADNSDSMAGKKAEHATLAIRELILSLQACGPRGPERSYFTLVLITWGGEAGLYPECNMVPVRKLDPRSVVLCGDAGASNMAKALELAYAGLSRYLVQVIERHPERSAHPLPVAIIFTDGCDETSNPTTTAKQIRELSVDGISVPLIAVGVSVEVSEPANEELLRSLVCPEYYLPISESRRLFAGVGSDPLATLGITGKEFAAGQIYGEARDKYEVISRVMRRLEQRETE